MLDHCTISIPAAHPGNPKGGAFFKGGANMLEGGAKKGAYSLRAVFTIFNMLLFA